jgi:hypothetical protein
MGHYEIDQAAVQALFADPLGPVGRIIEHKCLNVEGVMKELLLIPGSGRTYTTRFYRGRAGHFLFPGVPQVPGKLYAWPDRVPHTASAPGMPPASDSGQLLASIGHELEVRDTVVGVVHADKKYAVYLEDGTRYMAPRPFMKPALEIGVQLP